MKTYTKEEAVIALETGGTQAEVYAWPSSFETDTTFAFVVVYPTGDQWTVELHRKRVSRKIGTGLMRGWIEIDGFKDDAPRQETRCPTARAAVDHAIATYGVKDFMDYDTVGQKYRGRYLGDEGSG